MSRTIWSAYSSETVFGYPHQLSILIIYRLDALDSQKRPRPIGIRQAAATSCPALNNTIYHSITGADFRVTCNLDYPFNDLTSFYIGNMLLCMDQCAVWNSDNGTTSCVGIAWVPSVVSPDGSGNAACYLKRSMTVGENIWPWEVDSAKLQISSSISSSLSISSSSLISSSMTAAAVRH